MSAPPLQKKFRLHCKNQSFNIIYGNNRCYFWAPCGKNSFAKIIYIQNKRCSLWYTSLILDFKTCNCRSQGPRGLRPRSTAARLLGLWVPIPPGECLLWVLCVVRKRSLRRPDHSSRGILPTVVRRCLWFRNLVKEEALAHWGLSRQKQTNKIFNYRKCINGILLRTRIACVTFISYESSD